MVKKSLHNDLDFQEIKDRISNLKPSSKRKWGKMNAAQMLMHCSLVLNVPIGKTKLPKPFFVFRWIGALTKYEMTIFNNGIPHNMPTFKKLIVTFDSDFEKAQKELLQSLDRYRECYLQKQLPKSHSLFGKMSQKDWGFLEYKHLNHHLKQFSA